MKWCFTNFIFLTEPRYRHTLFLTLFFLVLLPFHHAYAGETSDQTANIDPHQRMKLVMNYLQQESMTAPGLPNALRTTAGWAMNGFHTFGDDLEFEVHPHLNFHGGWGGEGAALFHINMGPIESGKIVMGYMGGSNALTDSNHGFDLHSELHFNDRLSLNAGVRQNELSQTGNYAMLRWKLLSY